MGLALDEEACVIVVSHDCDIAQDPSIEADVEVIVGEWATRVDGNFSHAKNARRLHLSLTGSGQNVVADLRSDRKRGIPKAQLDGVSPFPSLFPTPSERVILQRWLASRYRRSAFTDEFDRRLDATGLREAIAKTLKKHGHFISAVYLDVDKGRQVTRLTPEDTYELSAYLLFDTRHDPIVAEKAATEAATAIAEAFMKKCRSTAGVWTDFELVECEAVSDQSMTVSQADSLARWSADHISLRSTPPAPMRNDE